LSILNKATNRKRIRKSFISAIALSIIFMLLMAARFPGTALAGGIGDVVTKVANANFSSAQFDFGTENSTGLNIKMHLGGGNIGNGYGGVTVLGPADASGMQAMLNYVDGQANHTSIQTTRMKGCEVREYTMSDGAGVGVVLPDYFITVELYETGNSSTSDINTAIEIAQQTLDGLERAGLLSQAAPDIKSASPELEEDKTTEKAAEVTGKPLDEAVPVSNTDNIAGVSNGPTAPTTFTINSPHLVTYIRNYHWNNAQGTTPGTIALQDGNGKIYGPWKATGTDGMGGVPNANWEVFPNIVIPAGTYTVIDSDPATWSQNQDSGGRGMGQVKATPHFEVTGGSVNDLLPGGKADATTGGSVNGESPAGVGSVGNIPGPSNTTEAVVGVAVPGLIATGLGALAGLGGGGGLTPPTTGGGSLPGAGGTSPGTSAQQTGMAQATNQIGRRRRDEEVFVSGTTAGAGYMPKPDNPLDVTNDDILINPGDKGESFVQPEPDKIIDTTDMSGVFIQTESGVMINNTAPGELPISGPTAGIIIDTSALEDAVPAAADVTPAVGAVEVESASGPEGEATGTTDETGYDRYDRNGYDKEGFDKEGYNREGFDRFGYDQEGFNAEGFDKAGFDKEGFNKAGFDAEGFDKLGFNQEGLDREGFNREGFDKSGFDKNGFNKEGFDKTGFDKEGFNKAGFDAEGFDKLGFNQEGLDKEGFNLEGFDKLGFDKNGFNKEGFDKTGFDKEGFNKAGFDKEGYGRNGFNSEGFDREGFDVNGYNAKGFNRSGYNSEGYNAAGYDKEGFNKEGWDAEGYGRNGLNQEGFDREGYDKAGYDKNGYNREGFDREGRQQEGYDEYGYDKNGFNKDGFDKDGYDREGFDYQGYNRGGYDPWGYDKNGYGKDGYHWSGYNADGYNRSGLHWTDNPYEGDSPFNVDVRNPFTEGQNVIVEMDDQGNRIDVAGSWKPTKPPLGEPYPKTVEEYGAKPWTNEPSPAVPTADTPSDSGIIGPEDPMNTLKNHDLGKETPTAPEGQSGSGLPFGEEAVEGASTQVPGENVPESGDLPQETIPETEDLQQDEIPGGQPVTGPQHGDTITLAGKDGRDYVLEYNTKTGEWENLLTGGKVANTDLESYVKDFERWQNDLVEMRARSAIDLEKMAARQDANSKAIDENLAKWKNLEQMQKAADKNNIGQKGGPGDMGKAIQDLKDDMLAGKEVDQDRMEQLKKIIGNRIEGKTAADTGQRWEEVPWYQDIDSALKANATTAKEVITGEKDDGSISWLGMGARIMITAATGGTAQVAIDGTLTVAEAMYRIKDAIDKGESDFRAVSKAIGMTVLGEEIGWLAGAAGGTLTKEMIERFPVFTNKAADFLENGLLKIMQADQIASRGLGLVSKESADETLKQINKRLTELGGDVAEETIEKAAKGTGKAISGSSDNIAKVDYDKLPTGKQKELMESQSNYDDYIETAGNKGKNLAAKVKNGEEITTEDLLNMKSDPATMRKFKEVQELTNLPEAEAQKIQTAFNEAIDKKIYKPSYDDVQSHLKEKIDDAINKKLTNPSDADVQSHLKNESYYRNLKAKYGDDIQVDVTVETIRTPGKEYHPWDINTDNDIHSVLTIKDKNGNILETREIPRSDWEDVYFKSYSKNTGMLDDAGNFNIELAKERYPDVEWEKMANDAERCKGWAELHEEAPTDVYHPEAARDFSTEKTAILNGNAPKTAPAGAAKGAQATLLDSQQLGQMESYKIGRYWNEGSVKSQTEALEQLGKLGNQTKGLEKGYLDMGYNIEPMPLKMEAAIEIAKNRNLSPSMRAAKLEELGFDGPADLANKLAGRIHSLKIAQK